MNPRVLRRWVVLLAGCVVAACQRERPAAAASADAVRAEITRLEERLRQGMARADTTLLAPLWAPEYLSTSAVGHTSSRAEALMAFGAGMVRLDTVTIRDLDVRPYGATAVSLGFLDWSGVAAGSRFNSTVRFQHVWVNSDGVWRIVASQLTNQPAAASRPAPGR
jgi:hypothetical protein